MFDQDKLYDIHLERKDATYDAIMRMVRMITNFARTGWVSSVKLRTASNFIAFDFIQFDFQTRNPSLGNDTPSKSCKSETEIHCQEISNEPNSSVTTNIKEQLHFERWREIEEIYKNLCIASSRP